MSDVMRSIELIELLKLLTMFSVGHRPLIYTVLCILYGRITTAVDCLYGRKTVVYGRIGLVYGRIAFNTYESGYNKSARNVPTIAVIPTYSTAHTHFQQDPQLFPPAKD